MCPSGNPATPIEKPSRSLMKRTSSYENSKPPSVFWKSPTPPGGSPRSARMLVMPSDARLRQHARRVVARRIDARHVRHRGEALLALDAIDDGQRLFARAAAGAVGDRTEIGLQLAERRNRLFEQRPLAFGGFRREKLERNDRPRAARCGKDVAYQPHVQISYPNEDRLVARSPSSVPRPRWRRRTSSNGRASEGSPKTTSRAAFPPNAPNTSLSWLNIDASWECEAGELFGTARATFDPARSWWRTAQGNIWEGAAERTSGVNRTHVDARRSVRSARPTAAGARAAALRSHRARRAANQKTVRRSRRTPAAIRAGRTVCRHAIAQIDRELQEEQRRYDRETSHGTNPVAQDQWKRRIRKQLEQP